MSAPAGSAPDKPRTKAPPLICRECGKVFNEARQQQLTVRDYVRHGDEIQCLNEPACRGRVLHAYYQSQGLKKWSRHTQEQLLPIMDLPPEKCDRKKWKSIHAIQDRVLAAVEFYSTCYPVCLLYAVQVDADGEPIKSFGQWKHHTTRSLSEILGVHQATVVRAIQYWAERNVLRWDDGRLYYDPEPKPLSASEREACTRISDADLKDLRALLPSVLRILKDLHEKLDAETFALIKAVAADACTRQNLDISDARTRAANTVLDACNGYVPLLSRATPREQHPKREHSPAPPKPSQSHSPEIHGGAEVPVEELWALGYGKSALGKLPSPRPTIEGPPSSPSGFSSSSISKEVKKKPSDLPDGDDDEKPKPEYASARDELKAIYLAKAQEHMPVRTLDRIEGIVVGKGKTLEEFLLKVKPHLGNTWKNPGGFLTDLARHGFEPAASPPQLKPKPKCPTCLADNQRGAVLQGGAIVACPNCSSVEWREELAAKLNPPPKVKGAGN